MLNLRNLLKVSACVLLIAGAMPVAMAANESFRVNLIATIDDDPAMESVSWTVFRNGTEEVKRAHKHTTYVNIPPGKYTVVARLIADDKTVIRKRNFFHTKDNTWVVVPMDD